MQFADVNPISRNAARVNSQGCEPLDVGSASIRSAATRRQLNPGETDAAIIRKPVFSSRLDSVRKYLTNQKEHHRKQAFQQEFIAMLKLNEMEYDERYVWD